MPMNDKEATMVRGPTVSVKVFGKTGCFSRPEMKVERVSYECPTPSAARGILDAILWRPEMRWHILRIKILNPVRFIPIKRNEVQSTVSYHKSKGVPGWMKDPSTFEPMLAGAGTDNATPRNTLALRDVAYVIEAEPIVFDDGDGVNTPQKYVEMFNRRVRKGQCFHRPSLGCREFAADFEMPDGSEQPVPESYDLGRMLYDIIFDRTYKNNRPVFFDARIENGVLETGVNSAISDETIRKEVLSCWFSRS